MVPRVRMDKVILGMLEIAVWKLVEVTRHFKLDSTVLHLLRCIQLKHLWTTSKNAPHRSECVQGFFLKLEYR